MFKTEQERNEYIEVLVSMARKSAEWQGPEAQDAAEGKVRFDWAGEAGPKPDWKRSTELKIEALKQARAAARDYEYSMSLYSKICHLENDLACYGK